MKNNRFVYTILTPIFICMIVFTLLPILIGLGISLFDYNPLAAGNAFVGFENFKKLTTDGVFHIALKNTLIFVLVTVSLNIVLALLIAQAISSMRSNKTRSFTRMIFFMPIVAPLAASSLVWKVMYANKYGLFNNILGNLGLPTQNWLGDPAWLLPAIILFTIWADIGYNIIIFSAGMDGIPHDFIEAAAIDGAGPVRRFFFITLPLLGRTTAFVVTMTLISHFQMFAQFEIMGRSAGSPGGGGPNNVGMVLTLEIYKEAFKYKNMGYASAIALVLFLIILVVTVISQRISRSDWRY
ncbi:sugar ABC transporter permease [Anoxybacterium hadale]|uniref:Sugar ABC transporter permease n=1 Tax=Anoxybacterium hadale TaxID=3408580 RepID=A0ACD1AFT0_9FIRM|nr:sugar ABC transporter permease [Clostridiales bacterium]